LADRDCDDHAGLAADRYCRYLGRILIGESILLRRFSIGFRSGSVNFASYNLERPMSFKFRLFVLFAVLALPITAIALDAPTIEFANRIFAVTGAGPVSLTFRNVSTMDADQVRVIRSGIETQLRSVGVRLVDAQQQSTAVRVTLSQNVRGWVWIAEITQRDSLKIAMLSVPVALQSDIARTGPMMLHKQLLFSSEEPILDVLAVNVANSKTMIALTPENVIAFQASGSGWVQLQKTKLIRNTVMPRDPRGHLVAASDHLFDVYLPGTVCSSGASIPLVISCRDADDLWPLGSQNAFFNSSRNYFTGLLRPGLGTQLSPFYSAASIKIAEREMWILAGVDGQVRWTDGGAEQLLAGTQDWGSDVAALYSGCGTGTQVIAASNSNSASEDSLRAYEILNRQAAAISTPLVFADSIISLWSRPGENTVTAAVRNAKGTYEAYAIDLSCN
jgi:hypothetical protein